MRRREALTDLIEEYAAGDIEEQKLALKVVSGIYLPSIDVRLGDDLRRMKATVEEILRAHGYFVEHGESGGLHPQSVYAVLNLAKYSGTEEDRRWGTNLFFKMLGVLGERASENASYEKHSADASLITSSLVQIVGAARASRSTLAWTN